MHQDSFAFSINQITKIEGHATLEVVVENKQVTRCRFSIADFKRFYTKAVENKPAIAVPSLLSRICGTCSNAHIMSALKAVEQALGIEVDQTTNRRRELVNAGMYIRDHALHLVVFVLPDVYGVDSIMDFNENDPVQREMIVNLFKLKAAGNHLAILSGGRAVHAPDMIVGGFNKPMDLSKIPPIIAELISVRPIALKLVELFGKLNFFFERNNLYLALRGQDHFDYILSRKFITSQGSEYTDDRYRSLLQHVAVPYSHASGYRFEGNDFMVGSLARLNLNKDLLHPHTISDCIEALKNFPTNNVYHNNLAQAIEIVDSIDYALDLLNTNNFEHTAIKSPTQQSGVGVGLIEAPRGLLYHQSVVTEGIIASHEVIVPTGQNQINIENDLKVLIGSNLDLSEAELVRECEKLIRAYDPCMSCAAHFLKLKLKR